MKLLIVLALLLPAFTGCTTLGLAPAQTLDQKIAYAYGGVTGVLQSIATATTAGTLTSSQANAANNMALQVKTVLDTARSLETTNATSAANDLALATAALTAVQSFLTSNGVK